jgi:hypothetical protein
MKNEMSAEKIITKKEMPAEKIIMPNVRTRRSR